MANPVSDFFNTLFNSGGGENASDAEAEYQEWLRKERDKAKADVDSTFAPYGLSDDAFAYGDPIRRKYTKFIMEDPTTGIKQQRRTSEADLAAALERQGLGKSATAVRKGAEMDKTYAKNQVKAAEQGDRAAKEVQKALQKAKADAYLAIEGSTDPAGNASMASTNAMLATDPGEFKPMYDVFDKILDGLLMRQEVDARKKEKSVYDMIMAGTPSSSARNIQGG